MRKNISGYLFGLILSAVAAVLVTVIAIIYLQGQLVRCFMSLGCTDNEPLTVLALLFGGHLLFAVVLAVFASRIFKSRAGVSFLINLAPLMAIIFLAVAVSLYRDYAHNRNRTLAVQNAISDAPAIHLSEPFVKKAEAPTGGVTLFLHVPFTVDRIVRAHSLNILVTSHEPSLDIRYSSKPECNSGFGVPAYGFHIVDHEYTEPPLPSYISGTKIVSEQLHPNMQYYLLRELHFGYSLCRVSDFQDFDPKQLKVTLDVAAVKQLREER